VCGFAGILNFDGTSVDPVALKRMTASIAHRGPDDEGHVLLGPVRSGTTPSPTIEFRSPEELSGREISGLSLGLGFRRLSIIDTSMAGHQPMCNEDGSVWLVFNGEFYNSTEYVGDLRARGHRFKSATDTEVIIHLYEEYGIRDTLERMNGMFSFALCDLQSGRLYLARDRVGIKPLYYHESGGHLVFASEVKAILEAPQVSRRFDGRRTRELLSNRYVNAPNTVFEGVRKVIPGTYRTLPLDRSTGRETRYWSLFDHIHERSAASEREYRSALIQSVSRRMRSDVPLGVFLSGGLDSSVIAGVVRRELERDLKTFSIEFGERSQMSEAWASREASSVLGTEHHGVQFHIDSLEHLPTIARHCEEPIADPALLPTYFLSEYTRRFVTVAISGEGSDESNYGYSMYALGRAGDLLRRMPTSLERLTLSSLAMLTNRQPLSRISRFLADPSGNHDQESFIPEEQLRTLLTPDAANGDASRGAWWRQNWRARSVFDALPLIHFHTWLTDDLLLKVDKMSMAHGLEVRVPYLDPDLLLLGFNVDARAKLTGRETKAVLRSIARSFVPPTISERPQHGFLVPLADLFERDLFSREAGSGYLRAYLEPARDLFDPEGAIRMFAPDGRVGHEASGRLWLLAMIGLAISEFRLSIA
jgi:asparagine synthase (glutamine-hydrolysing)